MDYTIPSIKKREEAAMKTPRRGEPICCASSLVLDFTRLRVKARHQEEAVMKKKVAYLVLIFLFPLSLMLYPQKVVSNEDKPLKGTWDFQMVKLWEIREPGGEIFAHIGQITSDDRETAFVVDRKSYKIFIIDKDGKFISSFGKRGEGPGEFKFLDRCFPIKNQLVIPDYHAVRVNYFSKQGKFLKSEVIPSTLRPRIMVDENRLISIPRTNVSNPRRKVDAHIYNIKDKSKNILFEYKSQMKTFTQKHSETTMTAYSYIDPAVTPMIISGYYHDRFYYGISSDYKITVKDLESLKEELVFSLEREKLRVSDRYRDDAIKGMTDFPDNIKKEIKWGYPYFHTCFWRIICDHNKNIYVFPPVIEPDQFNRRRLDIFSPGGQYIYSAEIATEEDTEIWGIHFKKDKLYLGIETEDGHIKLVKYKIRLPQ
jgi:hypothetical protein